MFRFEVLRHPKVRETEPREHGMLNVQFAEVLTDPVPYRIATLLGHVVQRDTFSLQHTQLDLRALSAGVYLLAAEGGTNAIGLVVQ